MLFKPQKHLIKSQNFLKTSNRFFSDKRKDMDIEHNIKMTTYKFTNEFNTTNMKKTKDPFAVYQTTEEYGKQLFKREKLLQLGSAFTYGTFGLNFSIWAEEVYVKKWLRTTITNPVFIFWVTSLFMATRLKSLATAQMNF